MFLPFVILIDLDGTIVGDVSPYLNEWTIEKNVRPSSPSNGSPAFAKGLRQGLESGLLRPHFKEFMHAAFSKHGLELYVATMSTSDWAPVVINNVENVVGKKFNRPIFTREIFDRDSKSLERVRPVVFGRLKKKYADLKRADQLVDRMMLIDNTDILLERDFWIKCRTYDFVPQYDMLHNLDPAFVSTNFTKLYGEIVRQGMLRRISGIGQSDSKSKRVEDLYTFLSHYYARLARQYAMSAAKNSREIQDRFWKKITAHLLPVLFSAVQHGGHTGGGRSSGLRQIVRNVNSIRMESETGS